MSFAPEVTVVNSGSRPGRQVVQIYASGVDEGPVALPVLVVSVVFKVSPSSKVRIRFIAAIGLCSVGKATALALMSAGSRSKLPPTRVTRPRYAVTPFLQGRDGCPSPSSATSSKRLRLSTHLLLTCRVPLSMPIIDP
jgi:hypothetical protein